MENTNYNKSSILNNKSKAQNSGKKYNKEEILKICNSTNQNCYDEMVKKLENTDHCSIKQAQPFDMKLHYQNQINIGTDNVDILNTQIHSNDDASTSDDFKEYLLFPNDDNTDSINNTDK